MIAKLINRPASIEFPQLIRRDGNFAASSRQVPEECAVAFSYDGTTHAVMMATPDDIEDFAVGFSLTEGIIQNHSEIEAISVLDLDLGIDVQIRLDDAQRSALSARRRHLAGPVGCGLCGIESIEQALRPVRNIAPSNLIFSAEQIVAAIDGLSSGQVLNAATRAVHGAGFYVANDHSGDDQNRHIMAVREDVGRHNALDKLAGALSRQNINGATGIVAVTSRISVEMVQKTAMIGAPVLVAISAPTALAIRTAEIAGLTLIALARGDEFDIYTHPERINTGSL